ncbi:MAG: ROK family protein [Chloroflexi bacterium]|nr:ROK family protein [Chloroflexota bacterium]
MGKSRDLWVGADLGGTSMMAAVIDVKTGTVLGEAKRRTKRELGAVAVTQRLGKCVQRAIDKAGVKRKDVRGVGVGIPGPVDPAEGRVVRCVNLGITWDGYALQEALERLIDLKVTIDNDVNVGAVGEHRFGAGRGADDLVVMFVGTGIGGGLVLDGRLRTGFRYSAGEVGHMVLMDGGPLCGCGERGHAEALASRSAIERYIREARASESGPIAEGHGEDEASAQMPSGEILAAIEAGDDVVQAAVAQAQRYLGLMVANCVNIIDPEIVVIGGGVLEKMGDAYLEPVRSVARQHFINKDDMDRVRIITAELGDHSGVIGAAVLASQRLLKG